MNKENEDLRIKDARICRDCTNLITADLTCPLCDEPTEPHPDREKPEGYCQECAEGPFKADKLRVVTWNENPYAQMDDGDLNTVCRKKCTADD